MKNSHSIKASPSRKPNPVSPQGENDAVQFLTDQYLLKKDGRQSYSLRDFAKEVGVSPAQLSQMMSRQRPVTYRQMSRILAALNTENSVADQIIRGIILKAGKTAKVSKKVRDDATERVRGRKSTQQDLVGEQNFSVFPIQKFKFISQWYHFAILELTYVENFQSNPKWIAAALGISQIEAKDALNRLEKLGFLTRTADGSLKKTHAKLMIETTKSEPEIRQYETTMLEKAKQELQITQKKNYDRRLLNSITFPVSPDLVPEIKTAIIQFQRQLLTILKDKKFTEVYHFGCQFFPVSQAQDSQLKEVHL